MNDVLLLLLVSLVVELSSDWSCLKLQKKISKEIVIVLHLEFACFKLSVKLNRPQFIRGMFNCVETEWGKNVFSRALLYIALVASCIS